MKTKAAALALTILLAAATGCGAATETSPASALEAPISISRGGGIAGTFYETKIEPDGSGVYDEAEFTGAEIEPKGFEVGEAELDELAEIAAETPFEEIGEARNPQCADCYAWTITYGDEELSVDSSTLETGEPGEAAAPLIDALSEVGPSPDPS